MAGFWMAPRALVVLLGKREITPTEYALVHVLAESGADREDGVVTTNAYLAELIGVSDKTIRRALRSLRDQGLIAYPDHERVALFTVHAGDALRSLVRSPEPAAMTAAVTAASAVTPPAEEGRKPALDEGKRATPSAVPRARANETETETEITPKTSSLAPRANAQDLVAYFVDRQRELVDEPVPSRVIGQVASRVKELLDDGVSPPTIANALALMLERRQNPATLPSLVLEAGAGPARSRQAEHPVDAFAREAWTANDAPRDDLARRRAE